MENDVILQYIQKLKDKTDAMKNLHKHDPFTMCELFDFKFIVLELELARKLELNEKEFKESREKQDKERKERFDAEMLKLS